MIQHEQTYVLFFDMIGQHFDHIWEYVNALSDTYDRKVTEFSNTKLNHILEYKKSNALNQELPFELKLKIKNL